MTEVLHVDPARPDPAVIARAAACLRDGGLVAFPTETVYGLGAHALDRAAVLKLFAAKGRPFTDPLIVHVAAVADIPPLVTGMPQLARDLAARFWPGPLTLVLLRSPAVPLEVTAGRETVAVRVPAHPVARALIEAARIPVAAPSANLFSRPSPTTAAHVLADLEGRIDMVIDGGPAHVGVESTVLDLSHGLPAILRPGALGIEQLRQLVPEVTMAEVSPSGSAAMSSPGMLPKHYSPAAPMTLYEGTRAPALEMLLRDAARLIDQGGTVAVLAFTEDIEALRDSSVRAVELGPERLPAEVAARLYAALRECDAIGPDTILARIPTSDHPLTTAIRDRLRRAASRVIRE
jgi:L-threonylcarbamoyladenylate synthase